MVARMRLVEETTADQWLNNADDDVLGCRGQGHHFPKLGRRRGTRKVPKGIKVHPPLDGVYQIDSTCPDCGTVRIMETSPDGEIRSPNRYRYEYPEGYRPPKGVAVSRRAAYSESWRRDREEIEAEAARNVG